MRMPLPLLLVSLLALGGCDAAPEAPPPAAPTEHVVTVTDAWVRLSPVANRPGSGYFTAEAQAMPETLMNVTSPAPGRVEMHESMTSGGMASMHAIDNVPFEAGKPLRFEPGDKHLMLYNIDPTVKPGDTLALTFTFSRAQPVTVQAKVIGAGDPAPE